MRKIFLFLLSFFIGISLFVWVLKFVGWSEIRKTLLVFRSWHGVVILILTFFLILVVSWRWKIILKSAGYEISFFELLKTRLSSYSITYLAPMIFFGGELFQGYVLKNKNAIPWSKGMASVIIDAIMNWTTNLVVIFLGVSFFLFKIGLPPLKLALIFGGAFLFWFVGIFFFYFKVFKKESIVNFFIQFFIPELKNKNLLNTEREIFNFFHLKQKYLWQAFSLSFLEDAIYLLRIWFLILFLGKTISFLPILSFLGFYYLAGMIPIPASLGTQEVLQVFAFGALGLGTGTGMAFTLIIRGADLILALLGIFALYRLGLTLVEIASLKNNKTINNH